MQEAARSHGVVGEEPKPFRFQVILSEFPEQPVFW